MQLRDIKAFLADQAVNEYVLTRDIVAEVHGDNEILSGTVDHDTTTATLFRDKENGRSQSAVSFSSRQESDRTKQMIRDAIATLERAVGPAWTLPLPSAPARVKLVDRTWKSTQAGAVALQRTLKAEKLAASFTAQRRYTETHTSTGMRGAFRASLVTVQTQSGLRRTRRRIDQLNLRELSALEQRRAVAERAEVRNVDLLLTGDALYPDGHGIWSPMVWQANGDRIRRGITRYRPGQRAIPEGAGDAIHLTSDGALNHGLNSAPFGEQGDGVRRFTFVKDGVAVGKGVTAREASLGAVNGNAGVRNLRIGKGSHEPATLQKTASRPVLEVSWWDALDVEPHSGTFVGIVGLGQLGSKQAVRGVVVAGNAFEWLARARMSNDWAHHGWAVGPRHMRIDDVRVT